MLQDVLDFSNESIEQQTALLPVGSYRATVFSVAPRHSARGNAVLRITWKLASGRCITDWLIYQSAEPSKFLMLGMKKIQDTLVAGQRQLKHSSLDALAKSLLGVQAEIEIEHEADDDGVLREKVRQVRPLRDPVAV